MIKKVLTIAILMIVSLSLTAQSRNNDTTKNVKKLPLIYRATAEYGQSVMYGNRFVTSPYHIIRTGVNLELPIRYGMGIQVGLKYSFVFGNKEKKYAHNGKAKYSYNGHMLDIPIHATYTLPIFWGLKIFAFAGTNLNIGLSQNETIKFTQKKVEGISKRSNIKNTPMAIKLTIKNSFKEMEFLPNQIGKLEKRNNNNINATEKQKKAIIEKVSL